MGVFDDLCSMTPLRLKAFCPTLSGNMRDSIHMKFQTQHTGVIEISGDSYVLGYWRKSKKIVRTGIYNYANDTNDYGTWFSGGNSQGWALKSVINAVQMICPQYNATYQVDITKTPSPNHPSRLYARRRAFIGGLKSLLAAQNFVQDWSWSYDWGWIYS